MDKMRCDYEGYLGEKDEQLKGAKEAIMAKDGALDEARGEITELRSGECSTCMETKTFFAHLKCGHMACTNCLEEQVRASTNLSSYPLKCLDGCGDVIDQSVVDALKLDDKTRARYVRFSVLCAFPHDYIVTCPGCQMMSYGGPLSDRAKQRARCEECYVNLCMRCEESWVRGHMCPEERAAARAAHRDANAKTIRFLEHLRASGYHVPCPTCKVDVAKNGGCNHMTCTLCDKLGKNANFCYTCGDQLQPGRHYRTDLEGKVHFPDGLYEPCRKSGDDDDTKDDGGGFAAAPG